MKYSQLNQKQFFEKRNFALTDTGLDTYCKDTDGEYTNSFGYENIVFKQKLRLHSEQNKWALKIGFAIFVISVISAGRKIANGVAPEIWLKNFAFDMCLVAFDLFYHFYKLRRYWLLAVNDEKYIFFLRGKKFDEAVKTFIADLFENQKEYYRSKYFFIDEDTPFENEKEKLKWLKENEFITAQEYEEILNKNQQVQPAGFSL